MALTTDSHPHNPLPMRHNHSHGYMHTTIKGYTQTYTYPQTLHILTHNVTWLHTTHLLDLLWIFDITLYYACDEDWV